MNLRYFKLFKKSPLVKSPVKRLSSAISRQRLGKLAGSAFFIFTTVSSQSLLLLTPNNSKVAAQTVTPALCANPGRDGAVTPTGIVNTYYPGTANASAGTNSITLGASTGAATPIATGDLLLVIQMQDAAINSSNTSAYGSTTSNNAGTYEYVVAQSNVTTTGGTLTIRGAGASNGLLNTYNNANATATQGQRRFQVVRVPQYSSITTLSNVTSATWNGSTGGIVAIDVAGNLGGGSINVSNQGFRGGGGRQLNGGTVNTTAFATPDYRYPTSASGTVGAHGAKGEGIAGTPRYVFNSATPALVNTNVEGYPNGSNAQGAPGNAGGGGTDGNPTTNDQNTGGGGGGNAGAGGKGGNAWSSSATVGGIGGAAFTGTANRLVLGGGGGAGSTNNATGTPASGLASSGAAGGGIVMLRSGTVSGVTITADGANANNTVANDGSGGGGAGGSVLVSATKASSVTVSAKGGTGGTNTGGGSPHGPGGGGGGGFVAHSTTVTPTATVTGGVNGTTVVGTPSNFGAAAGATGTSTPISTAIPGASSGAECLLSISGTVYKDNNTNNTFESGTDSTLSANISVTLYNDANSNNQIDTGEQVGSPVTTNTSGNYIFTEVFNGTYKIKVDTADTDIPSGNVLETSNDLLVALTGANITGQNFGFVPLPTSFGSCSSSPYISYNSPNTLGALNTNTLTLDTVGNSTFPYNAIGYNIVNDLIYGIRRTTATAAPFSNSNELVVIGSNGVPLNLGAVNGLPLLTTNSLYNSGDVAANNIYYVVNGLVAAKTFYRIDINPASPTYKQVVSNFSLPAPYNTTTYSFGDIAFNPVDGQIYAVLNTVNATTNAVTAQQLAKISPSSGSVTLLGTVTITDLDSFIGLFVDNQGNVYGYQGAAGKLWRYSSTTGARVLVKDNLPTASNNADGARCYNSPAISSLSARPQVLLVKRITRINSTAINTVVDDPNDSNDTNTKWLNNYLIGATTQSSIKPEDVVEYTIYFLSSGGNTAQNVNMCDLVPTNTTFVSDAFGGGLGIARATGSAAAVNLTNTADTDAGQYINANASLPTGVNCGAANTNGAVIVNLGNVPNATSAGTPTNSYGFIRFRVKVN